MRDLPGGALASGCLGCCALLLAISAAPAAAQQASLQAPPGPHYVGEPIELQVVAEGFDEDPQPQVQFDPPAQGTLSATGVSPSVSSSITIVNGRISRTKEVSFVYGFRYVGWKPGAVKIGPFRVVQGGVAKSVAPVRLQLVQVPTSDAVALTLGSPEGAIYVGQRVPVGVEIWIRKDLVGKLQGYALSVPLFDRVEDFQFLDVEPELRPGEEATDLVVETRQGSLRLSGRQHEETRDGERFVVVSAVRNLVPLAEGVQALPEATLVVSVAARWQRDFFGNREVTAVSKLRAVSPAQEIAVKTVPEEGRPPTFAGTIGSGFRLEVSADHSVVQVGEPITLSLTLRGDGDISAAALPRLDAPGMLDPAHFRVPPEPPTGSLQDGAKLFDAVVRVLDPSVSQIPALAYSWFDPEAQEFETAYSRPVALSVRAGETIGAADVVAAPGSEPEVAEAPAAAPRAPERPLALTGADLAIERSVDRLARDARTDGAPWLPGALYGGSTLAVAFAWLGRRRRDLDPARQRRRQLLRGELREVEAAAALGGREAASRVAGALRRMLAEVPEAASSELDAVLGACDARSFAPSSGGGEEPLDPELCRRALALARAIAERETG